MFDLFKNKEPDTLNFDQLIVRVNGINNNTNVKEIVDRIDITPDNFNKWVDNIFSEKIDKFDMGKLPYLIDELYKTEDKFKFMLCCMLLESTCDKLEFLTNLEQYPLFEAKFLTLLNTLVTVYDKVDNALANCMALIILNNDPGFRYFSDELVVKLIEATIRKLTDILNYLKNSKEIHPSVYDALELIVDMSCYLKNDEINKLVKEIDDLGDNKNADIFIIKYEAINDIPVNEEKLKTLKNDSQKLCTLYHVLEDIEEEDKYLKDVTQEQIAKSDMIRWLTHPTELGSVPDKIEFLGEFIFNNTKCYAYKFFKVGFPTDGDMLGISGGYPLNKVSANPCGYTFSKFEELSSDWKVQAEELANFIADYWKNRAKQN